MRATNRLIAGFFVVALSCAPLPSFAGLGEAEGGVKREFDAFCGKRGNKCKVTFTDSELIVNGRDKINKDQLKSYSTSWSEETTFSEVIKQGTILVIYEEGGKEGSGVFIFVNFQAYQDFVRSLSAFCGADCRPMGPSIKLEQ